MDKIKLNNLVVSMRKFVKQAKTHVINKCTKQRKILEHRKGNEDKLEKFKRKLERLLLEINILKKITPDSVSKRVLSKEKDWKTLLTKKNIPLEEKCFAMLAIHPSVQAAVEKFHAENKELIPKIALFMKDWNEQRQRADKIKKHQKGKPVINKRKTINTIKNKKVSHDVAGIQKEPQDENEQFLTNSLNFTKEGSQNIRSKLRAISMLNLKELQNVNKISAENADSNSSLLTKNSTLVEDDELKDSNSNCISEDNVSEEELQVKKENHEINRHQKKYQNKNSSKKFSSNSNPKEIRKISNNKEVEQELSSDDDYQSEKYLKSQVDKDLMNLQNAYENKSNLASLHTAVSSTKKFSNLNSNYSFTPKSDSKNKLKAITMLNLNELQDLDEIPIENSNIDAGEEMVEDTEKQKKDPFFLGGGDTISDSDDDGVGKQNGGKQDSSSFKKKSFNNFNKRESKNDSFHKRKFVREEQRMHGYKSNYRENSFQNKHSDKNINFKRNFRSNNEFHQNKKFKSLTNDMTKGKFNSKILNENPKEKAFVQNFHKDSKNSDYSSKHNLNNSRKTAKIDDKPLHPSWEAKRKLKEASSTKFQGKRIVYED